MYTMTENQNRPLTGTSLKLTACCAMFLDHLAKSQSFTGIPFLIFSDLIGRIAFPLFCLMLAEGFFHTRNLRRYQIRVLILALASEVPFDLALNGGWTLSSQNTCFTLLLGLFLFELLTKVRGAAALSYRRSVVIRLLLTAGFAAAAQLLCLDYGAMGIAALAACYFGCAPGGAGDGAKKRCTALFFACIFLNIDGFYDAGAFLSLIPAFLYSGDRPRRSRMFRYLFYLFYPAHLLLLAIIPGAGV